MEKIQNNFQISGFVAVSNPCIVGKAHVCHFALSIARTTGKGKDEKRSSALMNVETWCKAEDAEKTFGILKKGNLVLVEGFLKPQEWIDKNTNENRNQVTFQATNITLLKEAEKKK